VDTNLERQKRLAYVARRYYLEDRKQSDIAQELGVSRPLVSRMLSEARELGIVEITVHEPGAQSARLMDRLRLSGSIRGGVLVEDGGDDDATNRLLSQGAVELLGRLGTRRLGVGWGYLIGQLVTWLEENPRPDSAITDICPLVGNASFASLVRYGSLLQRQRACGRMLVYYFNQAGTVIQSEQDFAIQIPIGTLRQCPNIIGVCSANTSAKALEGALKTGMFTHLVARSKLVKSLLDA